MPPSFLRLPVLALRGGIAAAALLSATAADGFAAPAAGTIAGLARDALERPLAGAKVTVTTAEGKTVGTATTKDDGTYAVPGLPAGVYSVAVEKEGFKPANQIVTVPKDAGASADLTLAATQALDLALVNKQLNEARNQIQPKIGASVHTLSSEAIKNQPGGGYNNPLNQILLQSPGVSQDSFGQVHVRNDHNNIQYRINGIILPEAVTVFGQSLSPRFADSVELITGTLPAEYGLRTAAVVNIQTRSGSYANGGAVSFYGGSNYWRQPSAEVSGSYGNFNYFVTGDYLENNRGIEAPTAAYNPIHDVSHQGHGFAYLEGIIDATSKVSLAAGTYEGHFQIPNIPGQTGSFTVNGQAAFDSAQLNENQHELNDYAVFSYLKSEESFDFQISGYTRYSSLTFRPDVVGDVIFNGIAQDAYRRSFANGFQAEGSYELTADHTLRAGAIMTGERTVSKTNSTVTAAVDGVQTDDTPFLVTDSGGRTGWLYSLYAQDEWRPFLPLTINFGGRFDVVDEFTHENQISPRLNMVWQALRKTTLHAGYAKYFTPPPFELVSITSINKFVGTTAEPQVLQNSTVKAERADYFDVGADQDLGDLVDGLKVGVDGYYKHSHNLIDEGQFGAPIILTPFNYRVARNLGIEFTVSYEHGPFEAYGNLALAQQKGKDIVSSQFNFTADDLAFIMNHPIHTDHDQFLTASGGVAYTWRDTRFDVDMIVGSGLRATTLTPNDTALPTYEQVNFGVSHRFKQVPTGPLEIRADLINVLDRKYEIRSGTGVGVGAPQFGPRRTVFFGVRKEF